MGSFHYGIIVLVFQMLPFGQSPVIQDEVRVLTPAAFKSKLYENPGSLLLDVRTPEETKSGIIDGALNIDFNRPDFEKKIDALDKTKPYFVYCKSGVRSGKAAQLMKSKGFRTVYHLDGGTINWTNSGLKLVKP